VAEVVPLPLTKSAHFLAADWLAWFAVEVPVEAALPFLRRLEVPELHQQQQIVSDL